MASIGDTLSNFKIIVDRSEKLLSDKSNAIGAKSANSSPYSTVQRHFMFALMRGNKKLHLFILDRDTISRFEIHSRENLFFVFNYRTLLTRSYCRESSRRRLQENSTKFFSLGEMECECNFVFRHIGWWILRSSMEIQVLIAVPSKMMQKRDNRGK